MLQDENGKPIKGFGVIDDDVFKSLPEELREKLREPFPKEALKQHPTKSFLTTIKAMYVIERLNDVFGILGWDCEHEIVSYQNGYVLAKGRLYLREYDLYTIYQYGGHQTEGKNTEPSDGFKSAVTDLICKCASTLEIGIDVFKGNIAQPKTTSQPKSEKKTSKPTKEVKKEPVNVKERHPFIVELESLLKEYKDTDTLKSDAQEIIKQANENNLSEEELTAIKLMINNRYKQLKS